MSDDYRKLKVANLLYAIAKCGFASIPEGQKADAEKVYDVKLKGSLILAAYRTSKSLFKETRRLQNFLGRG